VGASRASSPYELGRLDGKVLKASDTTNSLPLPLSEGDAHRRARRYGSRELLGSLKNLIEARRIKIVVFTLANKALRLEHFEGGVCGRLDDVANFLVARARQLIKTRLGSCYRENALERDGMHVYI
jgi:hypothetical protein